MPNYRWLGFDELESQCRIPSFNGYRIHPYQSVSVVPSLLRDKLLSSKDSFSGVLLAIDGVNYDTARACWSPTGIVPLTSTFPTTSSVAWLTAATGLGAHEHGVPGVVWRAVQSDRSVFAFERVEREIGSYLTLFDSLAALGVRSVACIGDLVHWPGPWLNALVRGALVVNPIVDLCKYRYDPGAIVRWVDEEIARGLALLSHTHRRLLWIFVNFDAYIHRYGYDEVLQDALQKLNSCIHQWAKQNTVIAVSDHGMAACEPSAELEDVWQSINSTAYCELSSGGAGRVRWSYPREGREDEIRRRLRDEFSEHLFVTTYSDLVTMGLLVDTPDNARRIGSVVSLATGPRFPIQNIDFNFEHGSLSREEMFVPLAWWGQNEDFE